MARWGPLLHVFLLFFLALLIRCDFLLGILIKRIAAAGAAHPIRLAFVADLNRACAAGDDAFVRVGLLTKAAAFARVTELGHVRESIAGHFLLQVDHETVVFRD